MKLRNLNGAIRKTKNVKIWFKIPGGGLLVIVQKDSLLKQIGAAHGNDPNAETGLYIREEDGLVMAENPDDFPANPALRSAWENQVETMNSDDDDDLLGGVTATFTPEEADDDLLS